MRLFRSSLLIDSHSPHLSFPTVGTPRDGGGSDQAIQVSHGVAEGSGGTVYLPDTIKESSWTSFLSPSFVFEGIQNAYLPSALRVTTAVQTFVAPTPSPSDFWEMVMKYEKTLQEYVPCLLENAAKYFKSTKFTDITASMAHIVSATATFRDNIKGALDAHHITIDALTEELEGVFMKIANDLEKILPSNPNKAPGHTERADMVDKVLDDAAQALISLATRYRIDEEVVNTYLLALKPKVHVLTVAVGDISEQHPELLPALAFSVAALLIPESWILRPFLSLFGFGPAGPVKGSAAAWLQRRFWGGAVKAGCWFACLQAAGMGVFPKWAGLVTKVPLLIGGLFAIVPRFRRG